MDRFYEFTIKRFLSSGKKIPEDLRMLVEKFEKAIKILSEQPEEVRDRLTPIIVKSAALIAAELQIEYNSEPDKNRIDKRRKLELEAKALELLQKQYRQRN